MIGVDIGNTNISVAWFRKDTIIKTKTLPTRGMTQKAIAKLLTRCPHETIVLCSVVPQANRYFSKLKNDLVIVGKDIKVPVKSLYDKKLIGMDRLVGAYAAKTFFPKTRIIIDFGTAITLDFLSGSGTYQGGIILPGIGSTQKVLSECALLPNQIRYQKTTRLIPKSTAESISKGIETGFPCMINGLIASYRTILKMKSSERVVVTGGEARIIARKLNFSFDYEKFLVLKGLYLLGQALA